MAKNHSDEFQTPKEALIPLLPYLNKKWKIWECAWGGGSLAKHLIEYGFTVVGDATDDFLLNQRECDAIVTNPPYTLKDEFLERAYIIGKPFAFLLPLTTFDSVKRRSLFAKYGVEVIFLPKRVAFTTPSGKVGGAWFAVAWFCGNMKIGKELNFSDNEKVRK